MFYKVPVDMLPSRVSNTWMTENNNGILAISEDGKHIRVPVDKSNILITGVTGTGKTRSFTLPAAKTLLRTPNMKAVFFEIKDTFLEECFQRGDKIISYDGARFKEHLFKWNMIREIRQAQNREAEMKQISDFLFRELLNGSFQNTAWIQSARNLFIAVLRSIVDGTKENPSNYTLINSLRNKSIGEVLCYISTHPRNKSIIKEFRYVESMKVEDYIPTRRAEDIFFFFRKILEKFGGSFESRDGQDTIYEFLHTQNQNLFISYDLKTSESSRDFIVYCLKKIKDEKMSNTTNIKHIPLLLSFDEIDKLSSGKITADFGLFQMLTLGREYNIQLLVSSQSIENLYSLAEDFNSHIVEGGLAGFQEFISFHAGDTKTLETLQSLYGSEYKERIILPLSRYDKPHLQSEYLPIVSEADFSTLKTGEAYIKYRSHRPQKVYFLLGKE